MNWDPATSLTTWFADLLIFWHEIVSDRRLIGQVSLNYQRSVIADLHLSIIPDTSLVLNDEPRTHTKWALCDSTRIHPLLKAVFWFCYRPLLVMLRTWTYGSRLKSNSSSRALNFQFLKAFLHFCHHFKSKLTECRKNVNGNFYSSDQLVFFFNCSQRVASFRSQGR